MPNGFLGLGGGKGLYKQKLIFVKSIPQVPDTGARVLDYTIFAFQ